MPDAPPPATGPNLQISENFGQDTGWEISIVGTTLRITDYPDGCVSGGPEDFDFDLTAHTLDTLRIAIGAFGELAAIKVGGFDSTPAVELTVVDKLCPDPYTTGQTAIISGPI